MVVMVLEIRRSFGSTVFALEFPFASGMCDAAGVIITGSQLSAMNENGEVIEVSCAQLLARNGR